MSVLENANNCSPLLTRKQRQRRNRKRNKRRESIRIAQWLDDPHCRYCYAPLRSWKDGVLDHTLPASRGGGNGMTNAVLSCKLCDRAKGDRTVEEWHRDLLAGLFTIGGSFLTGDGPSTASSTDYVPVSPTSRRSSREVLLGSR